MKFIICFILCFFNLYAEKTINLLEEPLQAIEKKVIENNEKLNLGKKLFFDKRLSKDNSISCLSCHNVDFGGVDNLKKSFGVGGLEGNINTPTVLNSSLNWDGRAKTLAEQIDGPIHNPIEMATNWDEIIEKIKKVFSYKDYLNQFMVGSLQKKI